MTRENEAPMDSNRPADNNNNESALSILEKRLAEINARKNAQAGNQETSARTEGKPAPSSPNGSASQPAAPVQNSSAPENQKQENTPEEAPEIQPDLISNQETERVNGHTSAIADAQASEPAPENTAETATDTTATAEENHQPAASVQNNSATLTASQEQNTSVPENQKQENTPEEAPEIKADLKTEEQAETVNNHEAAIADAQAATSPATEENTSAPVTEPSEKEPAAQPVTASAQQNEDTDEDDVSETDYSTFSVEQLREELRQQMREASAKTNRLINELHFMYEEKMQQLRDEALHKFVQDGNSADDFEYRLSKEDQELQKAYKQYRENRLHEQRSEEEKKQLNLQRKQALLEELRNLNDAAETRKSMDRVKEIQAEWKEIGGVPAGEAQELWNSYHALLDIFYNNRSIFFELKELDRKRNLDAKMQLIERAEALTDEPSINKSLQELRHLHEEWKNIGPVPNEQRDSIWDRFIQASEKVHERKREYISQRRQVEGENLVKKQELLNQIEPYAAFESDRINSWREKTDEIQKLKEQWDAIGLVPKENADNVNKKFWSTYKAFFQHKNQFFKSLDEQKMRNLKLKTELCEQAEALKDSTDWYDTKEKLIQLQKQWKTIGRVPDKHSDKIWQRFRAACNEFFERKQNAAQQRNEEQEKQSAEKVEFCNNLSERLNASPVVAGTMEEFHQMHDKWQQLSADTPAKNAKLEEKFNSLMRRYLDTVPEVGYEEKNELLFQLQVEQLKSAPDANQKIYQKEQNIRREIGQLENDIRTLNTNIEFFSKSKNADKLREEYEGRIAEAEQRIELLKKQLAALRE